MIQVDKVITNINHDPTMRCMEFEFGISIRIPDEAVRRHGMESINWRGGLRAAFDAAYERAVDQVSKAN